MHSLSKRIETLERSSSTGISRLIFIGENESVTQAKDRLGIPPHVTVLAITCFTTDPAEKAPQCVGWT